MRSVPTGSAWLAFVLLLFALVPGPGAASSWIPVKEQDNIQIEARVRPATSLREFRGEVVLNAKPDRVVRLLQDLPNIPEWHYSTEQVEVIRTLGFTDAMVRIIIAPPWPLKKRDAVARVSLQVDEENNLIRITLLAQPNEVKPDPRYQRVGNLDAEWIIRQASETTSLVQYRTYIEPGGSIPRWFFNNVAMDVPLFTLRNLRRHFEKTGAG